MGAVGLTEGRAHDAAMTRGPLVATAETDHEFAGIDGPGGVMLALMGVIDRGAISRGQVTWSDGSITDVRGLGARGSYALV